MPRNFGITVDDSRFESFINSADKLQRLQLRVGILSGRPKYPAGHVGSKSRAKDDYNRFAALRAGASNPDRERSMLGAYRLNKLKAKGKSQSFQRRARRKRVAVAKVAAVVGLEVGKSRQSAGVAIASTLLGAKVAAKPKASRPKLPGLWIEATERQQPFLQQQAARAMQLAMEGKSPKAPIVRFGERLRIAYVAAVIREGHVDTRLLINTINWEITDLKRERFLRKQTRAMNKAKRLQREAAKRAKK
jgi:hypothetical protein